MAYYRGDYVPGYYRGDPGLFGALGGALKGFFEGGPIGAIKGGMTGLLGGRTTASGVPISTLGFAGGTVPVRVGGRTIQVTPTSPGAMKEPGLLGLGHRLVPGGETGYLLGRRRRMHVTNPKALRRAIRRVSGFGKTVSRMKRAIGKANTAVGNRHVARRAARRR